jgi:hypothetical protein
MVFVKGKNTSSEVVLDADIFILKSKREIWKVVNNLHKWWSKGKKKQSRYTPWRRLGGEVV